MVDIYPIISIVTLNSDCLTILIKRQVVRMDYKNKTHLYFVYKKLKYKDTYRLKIKGWRRYYMLTSIKRKSE